MAKDRPHTLWEPCRDIQNSWLLCLLFGEISWERGARLFPLEFVTSAAFQVKWGWNNQGGAGEVEGSAQCDPGLGELLRPGAGFPGLPRSTFGTFLADAALATLCYIPGQDEGAASLHPGISRVTHSPAL